MTIGLERLDLSKTSPKKKLSLQQNALACGMLQEKEDTTTNFKEEKGFRFHQNQELQDKDLELLVEKFRSDPKRCLAYARDNLLAISADKRIDQQEREDRVKRYIDAYFDLIIKLDTSAFPPSSEIKSGVPEYIPNGLVDMGSDSTFDAARRSREKILVDKKIIFEQSKKLFYDIFSKDLSKLDNGKIKNYFILRIAAFVHKEMPYSHENTKPFLNAKKSVPLSESFKRKLAVCRHHALYSQVLMQSFGITSRLLKCNVNFRENQEPMAHAANLVRNNFDWYLLDVTNPDLKKDVNDPNGISMEYEVFLKKLNERSIDLNNEKYDWKFQRNNGDIFHYENRNNMYHYIKDLQNPER